MNHIALPLRTFYVCERSAVQFLSKDFVRFSLSLILHKRDIYEIDRNGSAAPVFFFFLTAVSRESTGLPV